MGNIDQEFGEDSTPVNQVAGIPTNSGMIQLLSASFKGNVPNDGMPNEVTIVRENGTTPRYYCTYTHAKVALDKIESLRRECDYLVSLTNLLRSQIEDQQKGIAIRDLAINRFTTPLWLRASRRIRLMLGKNK